MAGGIDLIGGVMAHMLGLRTAARQDQLAANLARQAQQNQQAASAAAAEQAGSQAQVIQEFDPSAPVRRGQIIDITA